MHLPKWVLELKRPVVAALSAALLVAVVVSFLPNYYRSEARILPTESKNSGSLGSLAAAAAAMGVVAPGGDAGDANFRDILESRTLREALLRSRFTFKVNTCFFGPEVVKTQTLCEYLGAPDPDRAVQKVAQIVKVTRELQSRILVITVETTAPELSQLVVQRALKLLEEFVQHKTRTRGSVKAAFAGARLSEVRGEMTAVQSRFRDFLNENRNYLSSADPDVRLRGMTLENELKLYQQLVATLAMNREQALLEEKNDMPILNILDPGNLPTEKSRPARMLVVRILSLVVFILVFLWDKRYWIWNKIGREY